MTDSPNVTRAFHMHSPSMTMLQGHFTGIQNLNAELSQIATKLYKRDLLQPDKIITLRFPEQRTVSVPRFILPGDFS